MRRFNIIYIVEHLKPWIETLHTLALNSFGTLGQMFSDHLIPVSKPPLFPWWIAIPFWFVLLGLNAYFLFWVIFGIGSSALYRPSQDMVFAALYIGAGMPAFISFCFLLAGSHRTAYAVMFLTNPLAIAGAWLAW